MLRETFTFPFSALILIFTEPTLFVISLFADFELTVASAGIGYPFKVEQQYAKNIGKKVEVNLKEGKNVAGILKAFDADTVVLEWEEKRAVEGSKKKQLVKVEETIRRGNVKEIRDVVVW